MTGPRRPSRGAVPWLTAQSVVFGAMAALLGIVANAMFLEAYGSAWLPATYIAIGVAGIAVSGVIARTAQRFDLRGIALSVLGVAAVGLATSWIVAGNGTAAWVSIPLLILFPILIQLGFVFIGGQAGRLLDIAGIKASFPRIMAGFPVGAVLGGVLGGQLVAWLGRAEHLLLAAALAQAAFAGLVWITGRRYASQLAATGSGSGRDEPASAGAEAHQRPPLRRLMTSRFVVLILAYQVLSALGSQLSDFLVFDRATAQFPSAADLAVFIAGYTAIMNVVSIGFLFLVAGPLLRRFGLGLGIAANPLVLTLFAVGMLATFAIAGAASVALLVMVTAARIADIALTDGTTRTSINATYQVLPERPRLSVQTTVEGIGVPVAIGISGALILGLNALPFALVATIGVTALVCAAWTWIGLLLYRAYGPALVSALQRRPLLVPTAVLDATPEDEVVALELLSTRDPRATRLGLDLLTAMSSPALASELRGLAHDASLEVRLPARAALAAAGDVPAGRWLVDDLRTAAGSPSTALRLHAARALAVLDGGEREAAPALLEDPDPAVRRAALDSVRAGDTFALAPAIAALEAATTADAAAGAVGRLGDAVVPLMVEVLAGPKSVSLAMRLVRAATGESAARDEVLWRHVGHPDRDLGLVVIERLVGPGPAPEAGASALEAALLEDARHAARILQVMVALEVDPRTPDAAAALRRALEDELDLVGRRARAGLLARHGSARLGPVMVELGAGGPRGAIAREALGVVLGLHEARLALPLLEPDLEPADRLARLPSAVPPAGDPMDLEDWLGDLVADADGQWRSPWLRACALHVSRARGMLDRLDLVGARAAGDPVVDEILEDATGA